MPRTDVLFYQEADGAVPIVEWLDGLPPKAQDKCLVRLERLEELGHQLRRPLADYLGNGIYELRAAHRGIQYRMLYFFHGDSAVVVSHGLVKEQRIRPSEIDKAIRRKQRFQADPVRYAFRSRSG